METLSNGVAVLLAVIAGTWLRPLLHRPPWAFLVFLPLLTPVVWTGYAFGHALPILQGSPAYLLCLYPLLLAARLAPIAATVLAYTPSRTSATSRALLRTHRLPLRHRLRLHLLGPTGSIAAAAATVWLFAYTDFELSSLLGIDRWTVRLFDAHAGGLSAAATLQRLLPNLLLLLIPFTILLGLAALRRRVRTADNAAEGAESPSRAAGVTLTVLLTLQVAVPVWVLLQTGGLPDTAELTRLLPSCLPWTGVSLLGAAMVAAALAYRPHPHVALLLPFLLGPLVFGLLCLSLWQRPPFHLAYGTLLPLLLAYLFFLWAPAALVLRLMQDTIAPVSRHLLTQTQGDARVRRTLHWQVSRRPVYLTLAFLLLWIVTELTIASLLAPPGLTVISTRLYNLIHYGRAAALSRMLLLTFALPILLLLPAYLLARWWRPGRA